MTLDKNLNFKGHVNAICKKAGQKQHALARIAIYMNIEKLRTMMNTFAMFQFCYCPHVWMFHDGSVNKKINKIQQRSLRITYKDGCSSFEGLLMKAESVSIHQRNIKVLATEIFTTQSNIHRGLMKQIFVLKDIPYHLRSCRNIFAPKPKTTGYGTESACFLGSKIWHAMPSYIKESQTLSNFERKIERHDFGCSCSLCRLYICNLGFL